MYNLQEQRQNKNQVKTHASSGDLLMDQTSSSAGWFTWDLTSDNTLSVTRRRRLTVHTDGSSLVAFTTLFYSECQCIKRPWYLPGCFMLLLSAAFFPFQNELQSLFRINLTHWVTFQRQIWSISHFPATLGSALWAQRWDVTPPQIFVGLQSSSWINRWQIGAGCISSLSWPCTVLNVLKVKKQSTGKVWCSWVCLITTTAVKAQLSACLLPSRRKFPVLCLQSYRAVSFLRLRGSFSTVEQFILTTHYLFIQFIISALYEALRHWNMLM